MCLSIYVYSEMAIYCLRHIKYLIKYYEIRRIIGDFKSSSSFELYISQKIISKFNMLHIRH